MVSHGHPPGGFAPDGDLLGVAAERVDVLLDPLKCYPLVSQSEIGVPTASYLGRTEKPPGGESIVESDGDEWFTFFSNNKLLLYKNRRSICLPILCAF